MEVIKGNRGQIIFDCFSTGDNENWLSVSSDHVFVWGKAAFGWADFNFIKINVEIWLNFQSPVKVLIIYEKYLIY